MRWLQLLLKVWLASLCVATGASHGQTLKSVRVATGESPPFATETRSDGGVTVNVLRRALESEGYAVELVYLPWSRALLDAREGRFDITAQWADTAERRQSFLLSDNLFAERWSFVYRRNSSFDWQREEDLHQFRIGLVPNFAYTESIWQAVRAGVQPREAPSTELNGLRMVLAGRIDAMPMAIETGCALATRHLKPSEQNELTVHPLPFMVRRTMHAMLPKALPGSPALLAAINRGLAQLRSSGEYANLTQGQVACPIGWLSPQ
jgi:polar amino acid transport system substrate-binding protein